MASPLGSTGSSPLPSPRPSSSPRTSSRNKMKSPVGSTASSPPSSPRSPGHSSRISSASASRKNIAELQLQFSESSRFSFKQMINARKASSKRNEFTIRSLFEKGDQTETDIDQLHLRLEEKIQRIDNERKLQSSNQKKRKNSLLLRIITLAYFREPSIYSVASIVQQAKTGDLILMKKFQTYSFGSLDLTVANGINSCTTKGFISTEQNMQLWNQVGIVVELFDYDGSAAATPISGGTPGGSGKNKHKEMKYMLFADMSGIKLLDLAQVITSNLVNNSPVALRKLVVNSTERGIKIRESIQQLGWVILRQYDGTWYYDSSQEVHRGGNSDKLHDHHHHSRHPSGSEAPLSPEAEVVAAAETTTGDPDAQSSSVPVVATDDSDAAVAVSMTASGNDQLSDDQVLQDLIAVVINRTKLTLYTPSAEDIADSRRAFFALDANGDGTLEMKEVVMLLSGSAASSGADRAAHEEYVRQYLKAMDTNGDGVISVDEYVQAFRTLPVSVPNANLDVRAIINAEFVVCVYTAVGLIRPEYVADDISYLPHSFASTSTHASSSMNELLPSHIRARVATIRPLNVTDDTNGRANVIPTTTGRGMGTCTGSSRFAQHDFTRYINNRLRHYMMVQSRLKHELLVKLFD